MKHFALLSLLLSVPFLVKSQTVPNSGFEVWDTVASFIEPQGWRTSDEQTGQFGGLGVIRTSDAHTGTYAAQITTIYIGASPPTPYAGVLTNGTFTNGGTGFVGGSPFNYLPDTVFFYYKYSAPAFDSALVVVNFLHHNNQGGRDTTGYIITYLGSATNYTKAAIPVVKHDSIHNVTDSVLVIFLSCRNASLPDSGQLTVDDISFGGPYAGIAGVDKESAQIDIFPNPANEYLTVQMNDNRLLINSVTIYNIDGKKILFSTASENTRQLKMNTAGLVPGNYIVSIELADGTSARKLINISR